MTTTRFASALLATMVLSTGAWADGSTVSSGLLLEDDSLFDDFTPFEDDAFTAEVTEPGWQDDVTVKISHQLLAKITEEKSIEHNRSLALLRYQGSPLDNWILKASAQAEVFWNQDFHFSQNQEEVESDARLNEFYLQTSRGDHNWRLGRQTLVWGEVEGSGVLDVINTLDRGNLTVTDIEQMRLNQWLAVWNRFGTNRRTTAFVNLYPEFNPLPPKGSPLALAVPSLPSLDRDAPLFEVGGQLHWTLEGMDLALMAAYLYENQLSLVQGGQAVKANDYWLAGTSLSWAIDKWLWKGELAYKRGLAVLTQNLNHQKKDRVDAALGLEYTQNSSQSWNASLVAQHLLQHDDQLAIDKISGSVNLQYNHSLLKNDLALSVQVSRALDASTMMTNLSANYTFNDHWSSLLQLVHIEAEENSAMAHLDGDVRIAATLSYHF